MGDFMKLVYSDKKTGKTSEMEVPKDREGAFIGKMMGETLEGSTVGLDGYKMKITGLSDSSGAPSRAEIEGTRKARPLLSTGPGVKHPKKGFRTKRMVRGNQISADTSQVNTVIVEYGSKPVEELFKPKEKKE
ncbi:MAG: 30S ribosomal protein S6e [Candidatus Micrarchaeota archaeon]|nr:30S ribosomal protein S6e [Candidatus Micrarchaeota archaeon]MDE1833998.1 30S ribosomal protein S6e [Candidatus Micrarchaeota archaeon]MDE1859504.1 30S ribosomal protein S6e [Candidatus Micrarchaeota archaeon]